MTYKKDGGYPNGQSKIISEMTLTTHCQKSRVNDFTINSAKLYIENKLISNMKQNEMGVTSDDKKRLATHVTVVTPVMFSL